MEGNIHGSFIILSKQKLVLISLEIKKRGWTKKNSAPDKEAKEDGNDGLDDGDHHRELHLGRPLTHDDDVPLLQIPDDHWFSLGEVQGMRGIGVLHISSEKTPKQSRIDRCWPVVLIQTSLPDIVVYGGGSYGELAIMSIGKEKDIETSAMVMLRGKPIAGMRNFTCIKSKISRELKIATSLSNFLYLEFQVSEKAKNTSWYHFFRVLDDRVWCDRENFI